MTHPEELLAGYADNALSTQDRVAVESHIASCDRCREELALARGARSALSSLREVPAPAGLAQGAIDEAAGIRAISRSPAPMTQRRYQLLALAAAAAVVALLAVTLPHLGNNPTTAASSAAEDRKGSSAPSPRVQNQISIEVQQTDYDPTSLQGLAAAYKTTQFATAGAPTSDEISSAASGDVRDAASCLETAFPDFGGRLIRLIRATFRGTPAYLGVYIEGSGPDGQPKALSVRVASIDTCTLLSFTKANL